VPCQNILSAALFFQGTRKLRLASVSSKEGAPWKSTQGAGDCGDREGGGGDCNLPGEPPLASVLGNDGISVE